MRLNHADVVLDFEGNPVRDRPPSPDYPDPKPVTFRDVAMMALNSVPADIGAERKARVFALATKFYRGKFVKLTSEEATLLKECGGEGLTPLAFGRLCEWVEGEPQTVGTDDDSDDDTE